MELLNTDEEARRRPGPWGGEAYIDVYCAATLDVEDHLIPRFTDDVRTRIAATLSYVAERNDEPE